MRALRARWPSAEFTVLCHRPEQSRQILAGVNVETALQHDDDTTAVRRFYEQADLVISTPGGFLHEHDDISAALRGFGVALNLGKPLVLFARSLGPFSRSNNRGLVADLLQRASIVAVRDDLSLRHLLDCGVTGQHVICVPDVAFLWRRLHSDLFVAKTGSPRRAALCFRKWPHNDREEFRRTVAKARGLVEHAASRGIEEFLFVSTCQGIPNYVDDSELSVRIVDGLHPSLRDRCVVDRQRHHPEELIRLLSTRDVMFSMRLHGSLLAMLGGTPAMGLAYESKTPEIFRHMGLKKYQVPFTSFQTRWCDCASGLLEDLDHVRATLPDTLDRMSAGVHQALERLDAIAAGSRLYI